MANAHVTATVITNDVLRIAHNASAFLGHTNSDYKESWNGEYKPGTTVKAREALGVRSGLELVVVTGPGLAPLRVRVQ